MATHNVAAGKKGTGLVTLAAATADTVNFVEDMPIVEVIHISGTDPVWFTLDGSTPTVGGDNCYLLPPGAVDAREPEINDATSGRAVVKLISAGAPVVRVQRGA